MANRQLKQWHYRATTVLAVVTLLCVIAFFGQTFRSFFLTESDPVLVAVERIKQRRQGAPPPAGDAAPAEEPAGEAGASDEP